MKKSKMMLKNQGRICKKEDSGQVRSGINKWRKQSSKLNHTDQTEMRYWETISNCSSF